MIDETRYIPMYSREAPPRRVPLPGEVLADRKAKFASLLKYVAARQGWLSSVPGDVEVTLECLPGSSLPDELRAGAEYKVESDGETTRILPHAITTQIVSNPDGTLGPLTEGSSSRPVLTITHAGIVRVLKFRFKMP